MNKKSFPIIIVIQLIVIASFGQEPTKWRGPNENGIYNETGLLKQWPASGPEIVWHYDDLGEGYSSPVFANDLIYISAGIDSLGYIVVLNKEGKLQWKASYSREYYDSYPGARSSPTVVGDLLYIYSGHGVLTCMDATNGKVRWQKSSFDDFDGQKLNWGVCETAVVDGDVVYITPGGKKFNVVALNRYSGEVVWVSQGLGEPSAYCTPLLVELLARKLLVTHTANHIIGLDATTGKLLWSQPQTNQWAVHANTPVFFDNSLFCFSGYGAGCVKLDLNEDGSSVKVAWKSEKLDSRMGGAVLVNGHVYGSGDNNREWVCIDWKTGKETYASTEIMKGPVIYDEGNLYCYSERGELALVEATPKKFNIISETKVNMGSAQHWSHPVINDGRLYLRHGNVLMAYKIK